MKIGFKIGMGALAIGMISAPIAAAASTPQSGTLALFATPSASSATNKIVAVGIIGDYGTATSIDQNGKVDPNGNYVRIVLQKGGFEINATSLNKKATSSQPDVQANATCSFAFQTSDSITIFNGTGAYKGISGTIPVTEQVAIVGPRVKSGKNKGQCDQSNSAAPLAFGGGIYAHGTVKL